jgi:high-affinity nickel-transport protein
MFSYIPTASPLAILGLGLVLGVRHAADPDHVVAIGTIAARTRRLWPAMVLGIVWGLGHTVTLFSLASGIILFKWAVPPRLGLGLEFCVAVALVFLGVCNLHSHAHENAGPVGATGPRRAFLVGLVHGLAGSAAVALLVVATVSDPLWACAYLLMFGIGTLLGMTIITTGIALPIASAAHRWGGGDRLIRVATGALSVVMGLWLAYDIGWNDGLFLAATTWTPH